MNKLQNVLWFVANLFTLGALSRRRAHAARKADALENLREFERLSRLRGFRRQFLREVALRQINADPTKRHLPRHVRRGLARHSGNAAFRRERALPTPMSKSHRRRAMRVVYNLLRAPVPRTSDAAVTALATIAA